MFYDTSVINRDYTTHMTTYTATIIDEIEAVSNTLRFVKTTDAQYREVFATLQKLTHLLNKFLELERKGAA